MRIYILIEHNDCTTQRRRRRETNDENYILEYEIIYTVSYCEYKLEVVVKHL
jgi:hypothetical protein